MKPRPNRSVTSSVATSSTTSHDFSIFGSAEKGSPTYKPRQKRLLLLHLPLSSRSLIPVCLFLVLTTTLFLLGAWIQINNLQRLKAELKRGPPNGFYLYGQGIFRGVEEDERGGRGGRVKVERLTVGHVVIVDDVESICDGIIGLGVGVSSWENNGSRKQHQEVVMISIEKVMLIPQSWFHDFDLQPQAGRPSNPTAATTTNQEKTTAKRLLTLAREEYGITLLPISATLPNSKSILPTPMQLLNLTTYHKILYTPPKTLPIQNPNILLHTILNPTVFPTFKLATTHPENPPSSIMISPNFLLLTPSTSAFATAETLLQRTAASRSSLPDILSSLSPGETLFLPRKSTLLSATELYSSSPTSQDLKSWFIHFDDDSDHESEGGGEREHKIHKPWHIQDEHAVEKLKDRIIGQGGDVEAWTRYYDAYVERRKEVCLLDLVPYREKVKTFRWNPV